MALLALLLTLAFWPRAQRVDIGAVVRAPMQVSIREEAKTRVRDAYLVSAPFAGRVMRVAVEPGDPVISGETVIARMLPSHPSALDARGREQAQAAIGAAQAAVRAARAALSEALLVREQAEIDLSRLRQLFNTGTATQRELEQAEQHWRNANIRYDIASAAVSAREAELAGAQALVISYHELPPLNAAGAVGETLLALRAPISGRVLRVVQKSETTLAAGAPILEIGDIEGDLEVVAELLSTDAVQVQPGQRVIIEKWGRPHALSGVVERVEPWGFTKYSALGVEEQRVNTVIRLLDAGADLTRLGHGFRVEVQIVVWASESALVVPASALFRTRGQWAVYAVVDGRAQLRTVDIGHNNGQLAQVLSGLAEGESVVLYPSPGLAQDTRVRARQVQ